VTAKTAASSGRRGLRATSMCGSGGEGAACATPSHQVVMRATHTMTGAACDAGQQASARRAGTPREWVAFWQLGALHGLGVRAEQDQVRSGG
jgi:hypothetical protein